MMTEVNKFVRRAPLPKCPPRLSRNLNKGAGPLFVRGHRLASLYRMAIKHIIPFFVLKAQMILSVADAVFCVFAEQKGQEGIA